MPQRFTNLLVASNVLSITIALFALNEARRANRDEVPPLARAVMPIEAVESSPAPASTPPLHAWVTPQPLGDVARRLDRLEAWVAAMRAQIEVLSSSGGPVRMTFMDIGPQGYPYEAWRFSADPTLFLQEHQVRLNPLP